MNKFIAIVLSTCCALLLLVLLTTIWVFLNIEGTILQMFSAAFSVISGKGLYEFLKNKYRF